MRRWLAMLLLVVSAARAEPVVFSYPHAPGITNVGLAAEFTKGQVVPMTRDSAGAWTITFDLPPGAYAYKFSVNGQPMFDPNNPARKTIGKYEYSAITVGPKPAAAERGARFVYRDPTATAVFLAGEFNHWSTSATPLQRGSNDIWSVTLPLPNGRYQYKYVVDGRWITDPGNPLILDDGQGNLNSLKIVGPGAAEIRPVGIPRLGSLTLTPGQITEFRLPVSTNAWRIARKLNKPDVDLPLPRQPPTDDVRVALCVPAGFDPAARQPLLIVSGTINASCIEHLNHYYRPAALAGWVSLAADLATLPREERADSNAYRWAMILTALEHLHEHWPASTNWPVAAAGFSGGAKRSAYIGALLLDHGYDLVGMWMGGCNNDLASVALNIYSPPGPRYRTTPIFLSSGNRDDVARPDQVAAVQREMKGHGFRNTRLETYNGAHDPFPGHITVALNWFLAAPPPDQRR